jgi:hypothetical protein
MARTQFSRAIPPISLLSARTGSPTWMASRSRCWMASKCHSSSTPGSAAGAITTTSIISAARRRTCGPVWTGSTRVGVACRRLAASAPDPAAHPRAGSTAAQAVRRPEDSQGDPGGRHLEGSLDTLEDPCPEDSRGGPEDRRRADSTGHRTHRRPAASTAARGGPREVIHGRQASTAFPSDQKRAWLKQNRPAHHRVGRRLSKRPVNGARRRKPRSGGRPPPAAHRWSRS